MSAQRMTRGYLQVSSRVRGSLKAATFFVLALPLGGCGTGALWDKFTAKDDTFVEEPADKIYNEGLYLMNEKKDMKAANKKFEEVDRQHPYSDWARKSLLMSAYSSYQAGDYDSCIGAATRYVTLHPGSPDAAYAQYLIAASHYDQIPDISRDHRPAPRRRSPRWKRWCANIRHPNMRPRPRPRSRVRATSSPARK
ncbi:outer membrane assembly lipoprotein YfiO [Bradyrhizobium sp. LM2.3]